MQFHICIQLATTIHSSDLGPRVISYLLIETGYSTEHVQEMTYPNGVCAC